METLVDLLEKDARSWSAQEVEAYLRCIGFEDWCVGVRVGEINGERLLSLGADELHAMAREEDDVQRLLEHIQLLRGDHSALVRSPCEWVPQTSPRHVILRHSAGAVPLPRPSSAIVERRQESPSVLRRSCSSVLSSAMPHGSSKREVRRSFSGGAGCGAGGGERVEGSGLLSKSARKKSRALDKRLSSANGGLPGCESKGRFSFDIRRFLTAKASPPRRPDQEDADG
eukprot:TRINITY_DN3151_c0_g1_i1.p1 TRINITY_DN3151_c0_g1~~TRINITY_DN3151_c0_g1_i1.p1  ORF type:complete len:228 (-),score=52.00 TRINITY_DN3151_c0_g1_i1:299-982(-)